MIGAGKTSFAAITLPNYLMRLNSQLVINKKKDNNPMRNQLIFCCSIRTVMLQVANLAYNANIKFGMAFIHDKTNKVIIKDHFNTTPDDRVLIVCGVEAAIALLNSDITCRYWLFFDEPNAGADVNVSINRENINIGDKQALDTLYINASLLRQLPTRTILSSATMPSVELLKPLIDEHKKRHNNVVINTIYSPEIQIGCDVRTYSYNYILPHLKCTNKNQLLNAINNINNSPFLGRMYTHKVLIKMCNDIKIYIDANSYKEIDITTIFSDIKNLSYDNIRQISIKVLNKMSMLSDDVITKLCSMTLDTDSKDSTLDIKHLGTTDSWRCMNMTLIASNEPIKCALSWFADLLDDLKGITVKDMLDKYAKEEIKYNIAVDRIKSKEPIDKPMGYNEKKLMSNKKDTSIKNAKESKDIQNLDDFQPSYGFPLWAQINTIDHIRQYNKNNISKINPGLIRLTNDTNIVPLNSTVDDKLLILLMCGIGIYSQGNHNLDNLYNNYVLSMAMSGKLAYMVCDNSISFGTNYPFVRVILDETFGDTRSLNTLYQLWGRAGRYGQSWIGEVFVPNNTANKLLTAMTNNTNDSKIEADNILDMIAYIEKESRDKQEKEFQQLSLERMILEQNANLKPISAVIGNKPRVSGFGVGNDINTVWRQEENKYKKSDNNNWRPEEKKQSNKPTNNNSEQWFTQRRK